MAHQIDTNNFTFQGQFQMAISRKQKLPNIDNPLTCDLYKNE